ncbi:MAG TPA: insulinase family protein, partial [Thermoanaerobaculia bacterium]|nr:insulinase family protein [Thermoanaerobaculia bacterium]
MKSRVQSPKPRVPGQKPKVESRRSKVPSRGSRARVPSSGSRVPGPESFEFIKEKAGIREFRLRANDLRVLLLQNRVAPVATFAVVYHVGSRNEAVGHTGATHLLEHLMFKGTPEYNREKGTAIAAVLEALGARFNATTWFDRTNYYETLPSKELDVAMKIEASRMRGSLLRDEDRQPEMTVVRNEFERGENSPFQVLYKFTFATSFREHPYHH